MRRLSLALLATLFVLITSACSSTQPDTGGKQTASLSVVARANVELADCFELWVDTNVPPDGQPDSNLGTIRCYPAQGVEGRQNRQVPWRYSIEVSVIPVGSTTETLIGSSVVPGDFIDDFVSLTGFDETAPETSGTRPPETQPDGSKLYFVNGKRVSQGSALYIGSLGIDVGQPNILESPTFDVPIATGDTVIVRARKQPRADAPNFLQPVDPNDPAPTDETLQLFIDGRLSIGGVAVDVNGNPVSPVEDKTGFSFSFTRK